MCIYFCLVSMIAAVDYKKLLEEAIIQSDVIKIFDNLLTYAVEQ